MTDVLDYMLPPSWFSRHFHVTSKAHPKYTHVNGSWIWFIKGARGYPWDGNYFDDNFVYQSITEGPKGWEDPSSYKIFISKSWPKGGIAWSPRRIPDEPDGPLQCVTQDTTYETWQGGKLVNTQNLGGPAVAMLEGPLEMKVGRLDRHLCLVHSYMWGTQNLVQMERNVFARGLGWVRWQLFGQEHGRYALEQETLFDQVAEGGTPELVFEGKLP